MKAITGYQNLMVQAQQLDSNRDLKLQVLTDLHGTELLRTDVSAVPTELSENLESSVCQESHARAAHSTDSTCLQYPSLLSVYLHN